MHRVYGEYGVYGVSSVAFRVGAAIKRISGRRAISEDRQGGVFMFAL